MKDGQDFFASQNDFGIDRVLDSIDRVNGGVREIYSNLAEKHYDASLRMEEKECEKIMEDESVPLPERVKMTQDHHAFHNRQRADAQREGAEVAVEAASKTNEGIGRIIRRVLFGAAIGATGGALGGLLSDQDAEDIAKLAAGGALLGGTVGGLLGNNDEDEADEPENNEDNKEEEFDYSM